MGRAPKVSQQNAAIHFSLLTLRLAEEMLQISDEDLLFGPDTYDRALERYLFTFLSILKCTVLFASAVHKFEIFTRHSGDVQPRRHVVVRLFSGHSHSHLCGTRDT